MPYRINPNNPNEVQVYKGKKWKLLKRHATPEKARAHLLALKKNVRSHNGTETDL